MSGSRHRSSRSSVPGHRGIQPKLFSRYWSSVQPELPVDLEYWMLCSSAADRSTELIRVSESESGVCCGIQRQGQPPRHRDSTPESFRVTHRATAILMGGGQLEGFRKQSLRLVSTAENSTSELALSLCHRDITTVMTQEHEQDLRGFVLLLGEGFVLLLIKATDPTKP
eukprot:3904760-Rhodomonas_salina.2